MTTAKTRFGIVILVLGCALVGASVWITARRSNPLTALSNVEIEPAITTRKAYTPHDRIGPAPAPAPAAAAPPSERVDPGTPVTPDEMSQGLAQDLEMFNTDQLRAELESIGLSYPSVTLVTAFCATRPCHAQVTSQDVEQLNQYVEMVTSRFQGHVATRFETRVTPAGRQLLQAAFTIGTSARQALARYTHAGL